VGYGIETFILPVIRIMDDIVLYAYGLAFITMVQ